MYSLRLITSGPCRSIIAKGKTFATYAVGSKIPINIMKDGKDPTILADKDYPEWVFKLTDTLPARVALHDKYNSKGIDALTAEEARRLKKLSTTEGIKSDNLSASLD